MNEIEKKFISEMWQERIRETLQKSSVESREKTPAEWVIDLIRNPGFVLVSQDRYEELIRAETERDVLEATMVQDRYYAGAVMTSIRAARKGLYRSKSAEDEQVSETNDHAE